jgi:hypothetical protein
MGIPLSGVKRGSWGAGRVVPVSPQGSQHAYEGLRAILTKTAQFWAGAQLRGERLHSELPEDQPTREHVDR